MQRTELPRLFAFDIYAYVLAVSTEQGDAMLRKIAAMPTPNPATENYFSQRVFEPYGGAAPKYDDFPTTSPPCCSGGRLRVAVVKHEDHPYATQHCHL